MFKINLIKNQKKSDQGEFLRLKVVVLRKHLLLEISGMIWFHILKIMIILIPIMEQD